MTGDSVRARVYARLVPVILTGRTGRALEPSLLRVLARFADEVGTHLDAGAIPAKRGLGDVLAAAQSAEGDEAHEDLEPGAEEREYRADIRVHHRPPGGGPAPVTQHAGDLANDL